MPLFLFLSALFGRRGPAEIAAVIAAPLAKPAVRTGEFLFFLFFQGLHILNISKIGQRCKLQTAFFLKQQGI